MVVLEICCAFFYEEHRSPPPDGQEIAQSVIIQRSKFSFQAVNPFLSMKCGPAPDGGQSLISFGFVSSQVIGHDAFVKGYSTKPQPRKPLDPPYNFTGVSVRHASRPSCIPPPIPLASAQIRTSRHEED